MNHHRYHIPPGTKFRPCQSCRRTIGFIVNPDTGRRIPVNPDGTSHFTTCDDPKRFSKPKATWERPNHPEPLFPTSDE
jgi:hypothetical protein